MAARVLLVEPWYAGSHQAWCEGLKRHSRHDIQLLTREPAGWKNTMRLSAAELGARVESRPDLILASSMMDLAEFQQAAGLGDVPTLLYMHENQLTYDRARPDLERGAINWRSVLAADRTVFNSRFHLEDFFGTVGLVEADHALIEDRRKRAAVLPVGIEIDPRLEPPRRDADAPVILWNHRWEGDKVPLAFVEAIEALGDLPFRLLLLGNGSDSNRLRPRLVDRDPDRVIYSGHAPPQEYPDLLRLSDIAVSTAAQEFFGVSVAEAMAAGAIPLVPNRLAYPELLGSSLRSCLYQPGTLANRLRDLLADPVSRAALRTGAKAAGARFGWRTVAPRYDEAIDSMV